MNRLRREHHRLLGNGYCTRPPQLDCAFESICETCTEVPRAFRTVHPLGWTIWKGEVFAPSKEELLTGIQG